MKAVNTDGAGFHILGTDTFGRVRGISGRVTRELLGENVPVSMNVRIGTDYSADGCVRAHMISSRLGFVSYDCRDVVALSFPANLSLAHFEGLAAQAVAAGENVDYLVVPIFRGASRRPRGLTISAKGDRGFALDLSIVSVFG